MEEVVLNALYVAANVIRRMDGIAECTADSDNDSGEIVLTTKCGREYVLSVKETSGV